MTLPLDGSNRRRGRDPDEVEAVVSIVNACGGSVSRLDLHVAFQARDEEIEAIKGCQEFEFNDLLVFAGASVDVDLDAVRHGSSPKGLREPGIGLRVGLADIVGGQDSNCRGAGRWQQSGD